MTNALRLDPTLRMPVANVEMSPSALLDRQLARLSGVDLGTVRGRVFDDERRRRIELVRPVMADAFGRTAFLTAPFDLVNIAAAADAEGSDVVVPDYLQRVRPPGPRGDPRTAVSETTDYVRQVADFGVAVVGVAAVARSETDRGSSYTDLDLASFRDSGEIEYGPTTRSSSRASPAAPGGSCDTVRIVTAKSVTSARTFAVPTSRSAR